MRSNVLPKNVCFSALDFFFFFCVYHATYRYFFVHPMWLISILFSFAILAAGSRARSFDFYVLPWRTSTFRGRCVFVARNFLYFSNFPPVSRAPLFLWPWILAVIVGSHFHCAQSPNFITRTECAHFIYDMLWFGIVRSDAPASCMHSAHSRPLWSVTSLAKAQVWEPSREWESERGAFLVCSSFSEGEYALNALAMSWP